VFPLSTSLLAGTTRTIFLKMSRKSLEKLWILLQETEMVAQVKPPKTSVTIFYQ
jgi:hypothetical protein